MTDAAADMEAVRLDRAMARFDSARTAAPADAEAHRQFARLAQYFNLSSLAAEAWEHVLELEPGDARAWDGYLVALRWAGTFEFDRSFAFQNLLRSPSRQESSAEMLRIAAEGLATGGLGRRARWVELRSQAIERQAWQSVAGDKSRTTAQASAAAEPPGPELAPDIAQAMFDAEVDAIRWRTWRKNVSPLRSLLYYGIQPETVLEKAIELEDGLRADRPGYIYPGTRGDERESVRAEMIDAARILQARALAQLGQTERAGELLEEIAAESPGGESLGEYGRHLLRTGRPDEALDILVDAVAYEGSGYRGAAEEAATAAGLSADVVEERLAARGPVVQAERERRALGERLERAAPDLVLDDQNGVEWRLGDLTGKVVVLRFWATWCGHSLAELPHFARLVEKYEGDDGVTFLTVATAGSPREAVNRLLSENGYTFPVLFDDQGRAQDFEILGYPTTFYLDPDGLIQYRRQGFVEAGYERENAIRIDALRRPEAQATGGVTS